MTKVICSKQTFSSEIKFLPLINLKELRFFAIEISKIGAETVKPRQLEDDHQFNDI
jgi:hypothetical protein